MQLRYYQQEAISAIYDHLRGVTTNPCAVLPTGAGKTPCIATICNDVVTHWSGRVLVLAHVRELIEQASKTIGGMFPDLDTGVYSAGLKSRDTANAVILAGIQSVANRACELGKFDIILVDEVHMIPVSGEGQYRTFLNDALVVNPKLRVIGLTATPFRLTTGMICGPNNMLNQIVYEVGVRELIEKGYLCNLKSKSGKEIANTENLKKRGGEFIQKDIGTLMDHDDLVQSACTEVVSMTKERDGVLIFAASIEHGEHITNTLRNMGEGCEFVHGELSTGARNHIISKFKDRQVKYVVNVMVLTVGFDAPHISCVVLLRPTASCGLLYQMIGRGLRLHDSKKDCLVLDYAGNIERLGPIDNLKPVDKATGKGEGEAPQKTCPNCREIVHASLRECVECGSAFPEPEIKHDEYASIAPVLSAPPEEYNVQDISYWHHQPRDEKKTPSLKVEYKIGFNLHKCEWVCLEHKGFPKEKADDWWRARTHAPIPATIDEAILLIDKYQMRKTNTITVDENGKFDRILSYDMGAMPDRSEPIEESMRLSMDEIPF